MRNKRKNYKRGNQNYKNSRRTKNANKSKQKSRSSDLVDTKKKNLQFIKRSKESEKAQIRQKLIEDRYKKDSVPIENSLDNDIQEENPYEQLISYFQGKNQNENIAIDSSDEGSDDTSEQPEDSEADDNLDNQKFELDDVNMKMRTEDAENIMDLEFKNIEEEDDINITEEELDEETEKIETSKTVLRHDMFSKHFEFELAEEHLDNLLKKSCEIKKIQLKWPTVGNLNIEIPVKLNKVTNCSKINEKKLFLEDGKLYSEEGEPPQLMDYQNCELEEYIKPQIIKNIHNVNVDNSSKKDKIILTKLQVELFSIINNYQDLFYPKRTLDNAEEIRLTYCLHALNHVLKTRTKILHHNAKLTIANSKRQVVVPDTYQDQGLVRPRILILLPFKDSVFKVVNLIITLFYGEDAEKMKLSGGVMNYKRFEEDYTGNTLSFPKRNSKPDDYEKMFTGNTEDTFRIGISFTKKCIKLYTEFYSSDILLASPLGLRMIIGAQGDAERDYDFLSSIEILVLDQAELFFAQNWDHLLHVFDHFHLQLQSVRNTDFLRVRSWCLNGLSKFYRQTLLFTSHELPEFRSLFNNRCSNYVGKVKILNPIVDGSIKNVLIQIPQIFHKIEVSSIESSFDIRFKYFITDILPQYKSSSMAHCMLYIPSYFDYVRLRNYFKTEGINFVQICEYTKDAKIARARDMFYHSSAHFLLYSERAHFFRRTRIKGIRHLIMYQPPYWPNFYSEIINLMQESYQNPNDGLKSSMSITILYTKYDLLQISSIIGTERTSKLFTSDKMTHMFVNDIR